MKAITLTQPWATLVAIGAKRIETRSWGTNYRGLLAIHAAKRFPRNAKDLCFEREFSNALLGAKLPWGMIHTLDDFHLGYVLAVCKLTLVTEITGHETLWGEGDQKWPVKSERPFGDYTPGRFAWLLYDIQPLPDPIPARGALGLWEWNEPEL